MAADTSTAEIVRERPETPRPEPAEGPVASPPPVQPVVDFKDIASEITGIGRRMMPDPGAIRDAQMKATDARQDEMRRTKDRADTFALQVDATKKAAEAFGSEAAQRGQAMQPPNLPPTPPTGLRGFLASTKDEPAENAIAKLLQATSLFATMIGGGGRGGARASLSAFTGALEGWREGDRDRADRAFKQWKGETDRMLAAWETQVKGYELWFRSAGMPLEQKMRMLELDAIANKNDAMVDALRSGDAEKALRTLEDQQKAAIGVMEQAAKITASKEIADDRMKNYRETSERLFDLKERKLDMELKQQSESPLSDADMDKLAVIEFNGGRSPSFGMGKSADRTRYLVAKSRVADQLGGPAAVAARQSSLAGLKAEQASVMKVQGLVEAFSQTAAANLKDAEALSQKVDRSGSPMLNKWLLNGRKKWSGDPDVADFDAAARTGINETARVLNSANASGVISDTARQEIEEMLNTALTPEQFTRTVRRLLKEMENRRRSYANQLEEINREIQRAAAVPQATPPAAATPAPGAAAPKPTGKSRTITVNGKQVTVTED